MLFIYNEHWTNSVLLYTFPVLFTDRNSQIFLKMNPMYTKIKTPLQVGNKLFIKFVWYFFFQFFY